MRKQFLKQAYAKLEGGGRTWNDDDAEAKLRDLLGTKPIQGRREVDQNNRLCFWQPGGRLSGPGRAV